jgi:hypothetical protein
MSYHHKRRTLALAGDMTHGPSWYRAMEGVSTRMPRPRVWRALPSLGSLGNGETDGGTTLSTPTITDPTFQWQADVLAQLRAGVKTLQTAELQKWLQVAATLSIPLAAAIWRVIFRRGADPTV